MRRLSREDLFSRTSRRAMITRGGGGRWWCWYGGEESLMVDEEVLRMVFSLGSSAKQWCAFLFPGY
jgi:hypothetical protein